MTDDANPAPKRYQLEHAGDTLHLSGELRLADAPALWEEIQSVTSQDTQRVMFELSKVRTADGSIIALLSVISRRLRARGVESGLVGASSKIDSVLQIYAEPKGTTTDVKRAPEGVIVQLGRATVTVANEAKALLEFLGSLVLAAVVLVRHPRAGNWKDLAKLCERAGADATPIVLLINFLVGFVMAFQSAKQLKMFGANIYVADLVGISLARELAPLMTAIIVCGRSGAAYAAEIGSMKVNEEIDALRTLGLTPFGWLVVPRAIALLLVVPPLTLLADCVGVVGGLLVGVMDLNVTPQGYFNQTLVAVHGWDVLTGLIKSVAFALAIALIACQNGLSASGGAEDV
ncbi:MAG TPA: ABC transporter permease, partial [Polyangiaceae bacterium]